MSRQADSAKRESSHPLDLLSDLVAGTLPPAEAAGVRAHVDECATCAAELAAWRVTAVALRERGLRATPSAGLPDHIAAAIGAESNMAARTRRRVSWLFRFVAAQLPVVRRDIWPASAVVMAIGAAISLVPTRGAPGGALGLFAPLAAAIGIAMIYGQDNDPSLELALAAPVSPRLVVMARLVLVLAFDLILAVGASLVLAVVNGPSVALPLIGSWLGPMLLLGCLSLALSLALGTVTAIAIAGALWVVRALEVTDGPVLQRLAGLAPAIDAIWQTSLLTLGLAVAILLIAIVMAPRRDGLAASPAL